MDWKSNAMLLREWHILSACLQKWWMYDRPVDGIACAWRFVQSFYAQPLSFSSSSSSPLLPSMVILAIRRFVYEEGNAGWKLVDCYRFVYTRGKHADRDDCMVWLWRCIKWSRHYKDTRTCGSFNVLRCSLSLSELRHIERCKQRVNFASSLCHCAERIVE